MTLRERHQAKLMLKVCEELLRELEACADDVESPRAREAIRKVDEYSRTLNKVLPWLPTRNTFVK
jgi:hypothetical protein